MVPGALHPARGTANMNYLQLTRESLRIFRSNRLVWLLGSIMLLPTLVAAFRARVSFSYASGWLYSIFLLVFGFYAIIASGALVFLAHQAALDRRPPFIEAWTYSGRRVWRQIGAWLLIGMICAVVIIAAQVLGRIMITSLPEFLVVVLLFIIFMPTIDFCLRAIIIDDLKIARAAWTGFLIALNNLFRTLVIYAAIYFIQALLAILVAALELFVQHYFFHLPVSLAFNYQAYHQLISTLPVYLASLALGLFLRPFTTIIITLCYRQFTRDVAYPALAKPEPTA